MYIAAILALPLSGVLAASTLEHGQLTKDAAQQVGSALSQRPPVPDEIRAANKCAGEAISRLLQETQGTGKAEGKWRINLEIQDPERAPKLQIEIEPMDFDPGGGGRVTYDCTTRELTVIESFR